MSLGSHVAPWSGAAYRHLPEGSPYDVLDFRYAGRDPTNRWNEGEPTLYLASDEAVALAELARHFELTRTPGLARLVERRLYRLELGLDRVLDLCAPAAWEVLGLADAPRCFLEKTVARATAHYARYGLGVQAVRVPSVAFLDDVSRWCLVVFLERVPTDFVKRVERGALFRLER